MWDLGVPQQAASILYKDNDGCTAIANAQKATSRTIHMDIPNG
jgi:acetyl-CoA carboxylase alpha subunit